MKKFVVIRTPIPTLEEFRIAIGLSKKRANQILKRMKLTKT
jgi:hypothetical protein